MSCMQLERFQQDKKNADSQPADRGGAKKQVADHTATITCCSMLVSFSLVDRAQHC